MRRHSELHDALSRSDLARVVVLLDNGADLEEHSSHGWTPLMAASMHGLDLAQIRVLHPHSLFTGRAKSNASLSADSTS